MKWLVENFEKLIKKVPSFNLIYRGSVNGFSAQTFHDYCDEKGPTVVVVLSDNKMKFGGYNNYKWQTLNHVAWQNSPNDEAFLFSITKKTTHRIFQNKKFAFEQDYEFGPSFGKGRDLVIYSNCNENAHSFSNLGGSYERPPGEKKNSEANLTWFCDKKNFVVREIEVFTVNFELKNLNFEGY